MREVWIVDHGSRGDLGVLSMHPSADGAAESVRQRYGAPYRVSWEPLEHSRDGDEAVLVGEFSAVPGYSADHTAFFVMQRWVVDDAEPAD